MLHDGLRPALTSWEPYAWVATAAFGFLVAQSALQAGPLAASLPLLTIADPLVAGFIGVVALRERIALRPLVAVVELISIAVVVLAVFNLGGSPLVSESQHP